ncbi:MAG: hypothetical protein ACRD3N_18135 [Terracidiphilus sp.]
MAASRIFFIMTDSFLDGITGAGIFGKLRRPGAPTVLVDTRPAEGKEVWSMARHCMLAAAFKETARAAATEPKREAEATHGQGASFSRSKP